MRDLVWRPEVGRWTLLLTLFVGVNLWAVAFADNLDTTTAQDTSFPWFLLAQALSAIAAGALIKRWRGLWLAVLPALIAVPFGAPNDPEIYEPFPIFISYLVFVVPVLLVMIAAGVALGRVFRTRLRARLAMWSVLGVGILGCVPLAYATQNVARITSTGFKSSSAPFVFLAVFANI